MLQYLKNMANQAKTENGAATYATTNSDCLDLFSTIGALRHAQEEEVIHRFARAYAEDPALAMKIAFFARDVRGGMGERAVFRTILRYLSQNEPQSLLKNLENISEYGRFDDLLAVMDTPCQQQMLDYVAKLFKKDLAALEAGEDTVSLLAKWLPSVNASSAQTVHNAKRVARALRMNDAQYRRMLSRLRKKIAIIENHLREQDYSFSYEKQPSKAMYKYRKAFLRNDGERYQAFLANVQRGEATLHTGTLYPYEVIAPFVSSGMRRSISLEERRAIDTTWNALPDYGTGENALVVVDGSGSMYWDVQPSPIAVALSLGIYFAEHTRGHFANHFITFSANPRLVKIKGADLCEKVKYCATYNEMANTNLQKVFDLILNTAVKHHLPQSELPETLYIISDMEFDCCVEKRNATNFEYAKKLFHLHGYRLPRVVFWNVASRNLQQPVTMNEQGVALVSGCSPRLFSMVVSGVLSPYQYMMEILQAPRYAKIAA